MRSAVICGLILALLQGNVFAGISFQGEFKATNEDAQIFPKPGKPAASKNSFSGRVVNGKEASIEKYPYILYMEVDDGNDTVYSCGASIITYQHAFTAAHCVYRKVASAITLFGGSASKSGDAIEFKVSKVVVHPLYNPKTLENDAAIVEVAKTFRGYSNIVPIALQTANVPAGTSCYVAGWGLTNYDTQTSPDNLQHAILKALSPAACREAWSDLNSIICAQQGNGVDICQGDSGGPLVCNGRLTGASSFVAEGCRGEYPSGFARVMHPPIREFIRTIARV